ncbi:MAG TPA: 2-oxoglutarate and iron-dependent oxygenase domain-containing protein, partial [Chryseolinea sp.]|nr:2-oxoglutarate and iron-dependent oxygenase domain-containing protein [Chryseolinea sp.]
MQEILYETIPSLDLDDFHRGNASTKQRFVETLGEAYNNIGFAAIRNHFLSADMQSRLYDAIKKFFALPDDVKKKYELAGISGQRGYTGKGKEHAKGRNTGDLKEFYHVGQELPPDKLAKENYPPNVWPTEVPEFKAAAVDVYNALEQTGIYMLRAIALYLELPEKYFDDKIKEGNSILRPIHYFPIENPDAV